MKTLQIACTTNYDVFKEHGQQPKMVPSHVKRIQKSMAKNGFIPAKHIHCYRDGKFLRIIDGHNRFYAAKAQGVPVYYVIGEKADADLIADMNSAVRAWPLSAFINMYVVRGNPDYIKLDAYVRRGLNISSAASLLIGESSNSANANKLIKEGTFKVKTTKIIDRLLATLDAIASVNTIIQSQVFVNALAVLLKLKDFDENILIQRIQSNPRMLVKCATRDQALESIEEIYNFRSREKANLSFAAQEYLRANSPLKARHAAA